MVSHMKTTVEIPDSLLSEARKVASEEGSTLRAVIEEGLRLAVERRARRGRFRLRKASFKGRGLQPQARGTGWDRMRDLSYEGRGT